MLKYLIKKHLLNKKIEKIENEFIENNKIIYYSNKRKHSIPLNKVIECSVKETYLLSKYADMVHQNYLIVPISGGWICKGLKSHYSINLDKECTCKYFSIHKSCKHIDMLEGELLYKQKVIIERNNFQPYINK